MKRRKVLSKLPKEDGEMSKTEELKGKENREEKLKLFGSRKKVMSWILMR